jgi:hypothetical protein
VRKTASKVAAPNAQCGFSNDLIIARDGDGGDAVAGERPTLDGDDSC